MISVKNVSIQGLPVLEIFPAEQENQALPTVIFYHGWTSQKESAMVNGYELAKNGFRALLPEADLHGERKPSSSTTQENMDFWRVVVHNLQEMESMIDYYQQKGLIDEDRIGVAGLSMGGITTCAALTQFPWIKAAAVLMGSPSPVLFSKWLLQSKWAEGMDVPFDQEAFDEMTAPLKKIALNLQPEKIAERPIYFWHGTNDDLVPYKLTADFYEKVKDEPYAKNLQFQTTKGGIHKVPYTVSVEMASFFEKVL